VGETLALPDTESLSVPSFSKLVRMAILAELCLFYFLKYIFVVEPKFIVLLLLQKATNLRRSEPS
jgi:hypothetical protein